MKVIRAIIVLIVVGVLSAGCGSTKRLSVEEYRKRIEELVEERTALVSCVERVGIRAGIFGTATTLGRIDTLHPLTNAQDTIYDWLCLNGKGYTSCYEPKEPPEELETPHYEMCQQLWVMKDSLHACENELLYFMCGSAMYDDDHLRSSLERFENAASRFESLLGQIARKLYQLH